MGKRTNPAQLAAKVKTFLNTRLCDIPGLEALKNGDDNATNTLLMNLDYIAFDPISCFDEAKNAPADNIEGIHEHFIHYQHPIPSQVTVEDYLWSKLSEYGIPIGKKKDFQTLREITQEEDPLVAIAQILQQMSYPSNHPLTEKQEGELMNHIHSALGYYDFLSALDKLAHGKRPNHAERDELPQAIAMIRNMAHTDAKISKTQKKQAHTADYIEEQAIYDVAHQIFLSLLTATDQNSKRSSNVPDYISNEVFSDLLTEFRTILKTANDEEKRTLRKALNEKIKNIVRENQAEIDYKKTAGDIHGSSTDADRSAKFYAYLATQLTDICKEANIQTSIGGPGL